MRYYPVCLDIKDKKCLMVGGGKVSTRKIISLIDCGAIVTVVSLEFSKKLQRLAENKMVILEKRCYKVSDLKGVFLVFCTADDKELNWQISEDARKLNIFCNVADMPDKGDFILPAVVKQGDLSIAVSTSGKSPALARKLRMELELQFGKEYSKLLCLMGQLREKLLKEEHDPETHKYIFRKLLDSGILEMIKAGKNSDIDLLLRKVTGICL